MIFERPTSKEDAEHILNACLFDPQSKDKPIDQLNVVKWYKNFLNDENRTFVNQVLKEWLLSNDYNYVMEASALIHLCNIVSLLDPLKLCLKNCKKQTTKLHKMYCKMIEKAIQDLSSEQ